MTADDKRAEILRVVELQHELEPHGTDGFLDVVLAGLTTMPPDEARLVLCGLADQLRGEQLDGMLAEARVQHQALRECYPSERGIPETVSEIPVEAAS